MGWESWSSSAIKSASNSDTLEKSEFFAKVDRVCELEQQWLSDINSFITTKALSCTQTALANKTEEKNTVNPDDLLSFLHTALESERNSTFANRIQQRFPIAFKGRQSDY